MRLSVRGTRRVFARASGDDGLSLLEVVVSLMIIAVVMTSAAGFFLNSLKSTGGASARQTAVNVVNQQLETIRAVPAVALVTGRTLTSVQALLSWSGAAALTLYDDTSNTQTGALDYDPTATASSVAAVPTTSTQTVNDEQFVVRTFIDPCWLPVGTAQTAAINNLACGPTYTANTSTSATTMLLRVTVAATWVGGSSTDCTTGCTYSASTLVDSHNDPQFQSYISQPVITGISPSTIGAGATATITVAGSGYVAGATASSCANATVGTINQSTNTGVQIQIPITAGSSPGTCTLTITNPDGGSVNTTFTISQPPTISSISPAVLNYASGSLTITGANFGSSTVVPASGTWATTSRSGTTGITGTYTANAPAAGSVAVAVTNADGGQGAGSITVSQSHPVVTTKSTSSVVAGQPTSVTLTGTDFAPTGETISVVGATVTGYVYAANSVSFTLLAAGFPRPISLAVVNPDNGTSAGVTLSVGTSSPVVTGFSPLTITRGTPTAITVTGTGFVTTPTLPEVIVRYGGLTLIDQLATSATSTAGSFTATVPTFGWFPGTYPMTVQVRNADGGLSATYSISLVLR